ncbi:MAG: type II toxin-antitoxin system RelE/ParE family toxin [Bacteroidetes bacterium]|nr:type II toxin-antitoxin system RelE/ParE family toxin [Bacteroidota bacterium]
MKVFISRRALRNYNSIKEYITEQFGAKTSEAFTRKTDETFQLLEDFPEMGSIENNDIRGFQLSRQTRILYRIKREKIIILSLFDVRQNPKKRPK